MIGHESGYSLSLLFLRSTLVTVINTHLHKIFYETSELLELRVKATHRDRTSKQNTRYKANVRQAIGR